jgi:uncharacterized repeat protein (TIGR01451 family)
MDVSFGPTPATVEVGTRIDYTINIENVGTVDLHDVSVSQPDDLGCHREPPYTGIDVIAVGQTATLNCTFTPVGTGTNTLGVAVHAAELPGNTNVLRQFEATPATAPRLVVKKTTDLVNYILGMQINEPMTYEFKVFNVGIGDLTNVVIDDPAVPACDATYTSLSQGASTTYSCGYTPTELGTFTNNATHDSDQTLPTVTNDVTLPVHGPQVVPTITGPATSPLNDDITYQVTLTNAGDADLTLVSVDSDLSADCDRTDLSIAQGDDLTYTCSYDPIATGTTTNTITVDSQETNHPVDASWTTDVVAPTGPDLTLTLDGPAESTLSQGVPYTITAYNTGNTALTGLSINSDIEDSCDRSGQSIAVGQNLTYTCTHHPNAAGSVTNQITADSIQADPDSVQLTTDVLDPGFLVQKSGHEAAISLGDPINYTIRVTNTSGQNQTGVTVSDPNAPDCDQTIGDLAAGAQHIVTCSLTPGQPGWVTNVATVSSDQVADVPSNEVRTKVITPGAGLLAPLTAEDTILLGQTIHYRLILTNSGTVALTGVNVADQNAPDCDRQVGNLAVGASTTIDCTYTPTEAGVRSNMALIDSNEAALAASDTVFTNVIDPDTVLTAVKSADDTVQVGEPIDYTIEITNTGDEALTGVAVDDANAPGCSGPVADIPVGDSTTVDCTFTTMAPGARTNTAVVSTDQLPDITTNEVSTEVTDPGLIPVKSVDEATVVVGELIHYGIVIANTSDTTLTGVHVDDPNAPGCTGDVADIALGASATVECTYTPDTPGLRFNTATVSSDQTPDVSTNQVVTNVITAGLTAQKTVDEPTVEVGEPINYDIEVSNTSAEVLTGVTVTDPNAPDCSQAVPDIAIGGSATVSCAFTPTEIGTRTNVATVFSDMSPEGVLSNEVSTEVTGCVPTFSDVREDHAFFEEICWMVDNEITTGYSDGTYRPGRDVTRMAMSAFMYRLAGQPTFPDPPTASFPDAATDHVFFTEIEWMAEEGITTGYADGTFRPGIGVTRMAMGAFMYRLAGEPTFPDPGTASFPDVATTSTFFTEIEWMVDEGITTGYTDGTFRPARNVTRMAMSAFMQRLFPLLPD